MKRIRILGHLTSSTGYSIKFSEVVCVACIASGSQSHSHVLKHTCYNFILQYSTTITTNSYWDDWYLVYLTNDKSDVDFVWKCYRMTHKRRFCIGYFKFFVFPIDINMPKTRLTHSWWQVLWASRKSITYRGGLFRCKKQKSIWILNKVV